MGTTLLVVWSLCLTLGLAFLLGTVLAAEPKDRRSAKDRWRSTYVVEFDGVTFRTDDAAFAVSLLAAARVRRRSDAAAEREAHRMRAPHARRLTPVSPVEAAIDVQRLRRVETQRLGSESRHPELVEGPRRR